MLVTDAAAASCRSSANTRCGRARSPASPAGSAPSRSSGRRKTRSTSRSARAATPASAPARRTRSASTTRSISPSARTHRDCVKACGAIGAIDFSRTRRCAKGRVRSGARPVARSRSSACTQLPQGYLAPGDDPLEQALAGAEARRRWWASSRSRSFFQYREKICAHSRSGKQGCNACIDVCSSGAIQPDGDHVSVEAHLCAGCGGCATVCPSGAMTYAYPKVPDTGRAPEDRARHLPRRRRQGRLHPVPRCRDGRAVLLAYGRKGKGLAGARDPDRMLPRRLDRHGPDAGRDGLRREPGRHPGRPKRPPTAMSRR